MDYAIIRKIIRDCAKLDRIAYDRVPVVTVAHDNDRSLLHNGKYYSPLIDTIEDDLSSKGLHCVSIARIISTIKGEIAYGRVVSPEGGFARALVQKRLLGLVRRNTYPYSRMEEAVWGDILDKTGAKKVFGIQPSRELCVACHKRGVWVADVQHGVIADTHPWYGEAFRVGDPGEYLPDAFLLWDSGSEKVIAKWARAKSISMHVIGNRWLARFARPLKDDRLVAELSRNYEHEATKDNEKKTILVSLSWGEDNIPNGFIVDGLENVIRKTAHIYRWLIRLHPNQIRGFATDEGPRFVKYFNNNLRGCAEWEQATRAPLPVILKNIDLHISWHSSVCIEAAQMGVKSALLNPRLRSRELIGDYYSYYRHAGLVELVREKQTDIASWIERNIDSKRSAELFEEVDESYRQLINFLSE